MTEHRPARSARLSWRALASLVVLTTCAAPLGCAKQKSSPGAAEAPAFDGAYAGAPASDDLSVFERELAVAEADLRRLGIEPQRAVVTEQVPPAGAAAGEDFDEAEAADDDAAADAPAPSAPMEPQVEAEEAPADVSSRDRREDRKSGRVLERQQKDRCVSICDLAKTMCELESKICGLAADHEGDARYTNACQRASRDCEVGEEACHVCTP